MTLSVGYIIYDTYAEFSYNRSYLASWWSHWSSRECVRGSFQWRRRYDGCYTPLRTPLSAWVWASSLHHYVLVASRTSHYTLVPCRGSLPRRPTFTSNAFHHFREKSFVYFSFSDTFFFICGKVMRPRNNKYPSSHCLYLVRHTRIRSKWFYINEFMNVEENIATGQ